MANYYYIQTTNHPTPCKVQAEKIEELGSVNSNSHTFVLKDAQGQEVGHFRGGAVIGWWKKEEL
jgi:hypothetical protein